MSDEPLLGELNAFLDTLGSKQEKEKEEQAKQEQGKEPSSSTGEQYSTSANEPKQTSRIRPVVNGSNDNVKKFYEKLEEFGINIDQLYNILESKGNVQVLSGAGSGKTLAIVLKIIRDLIAGDMLKIVTVPSAVGDNTVVVPEKVLVSTFLNSGAKEIKRVFMDWCRKLGIVGVDFNNISFKTIHAEVKEALTAMGVNMRLIENTTPYIKQVMKIYDIRSSSATTRNASYEEVNDVALMLAFARNRLDDRRYTQPLMDEYRITSMTLDMMLSDFKKLRQSSGGVDFEDMQEMLLDALKMNPNVRQFIANRYDHIYLDEFQDTSQLQYELLKYYFQGAKRVVTIGDDDQTIYSWRGSDINIITKEFAKDFNPEIMTLTTNYRCKENILNCLIPSIEKNENRYPKELKAFKKGGEVNVVLSSDVNRLVSSIQEDLAKNYSVGVLARINSDLLVPALMLELDGSIDFTISKSVSLNARMPRQILGTMDLVTKRVTEEFEGHLSLFIPTYNKYEAKNLFNVLLTNKTMSLYTIPMKDLENSVPTLVPFIKGLREAKKQGDTFAYLYILGVLESTTYATKSKYSQKAREFVSFLRDIILHNKDVKDLSLQQIDHLFSATLPERLSRRAKYGENAEIKLTTVHEAKGKEWSSVYVWNDTEGVFPNKVSNRETTQEEFEEERRIHYIAGTRAVEKLTFFTSKLNMGQFLKECDLSNIEGGVIEEPVLMKTVYRTAKPEDGQTPMEDVKGTDTLLREYIASLYETASLSNEKLANLEIVLANKQFEELVIHADDSYGVDLTEDDADELFTLMFSNLADKIISSGSYNA